MIGDWPSHPSTRESVTYGITRQELMDEIVSEISQQLFLLSTLRGISFYFLFFQSEI